MYFFIGKLKSLFSRLIRMATLERGPTVQYLIKLTWSQNQFFCWAPFESGVPWKTLGKDVIIYSVTPQSTHYILGIVISVWEIQGCVRPTQTLISWGLCLFLDMSREEVTPWFLNYSRWNPNRPAINPITQVSLRLKDDRNETMRPNK